MLEYVTQVTLDIIGLAGFGYEFNALEHGSESDELSRACSTVMNSFTVAPISSILSIFLPGFALLVSTLCLPLRAAWGSSNKYTDTSTQTANQAEQRGTSFEGDHVSHRQSAVR
jgi:hypothetical protein